MTTIVSLIVLVPVAFFQKTGIDAYAPLARVIIGGLSISTLLTLFVVPVLHEAFDDLAVWWNMRRERSSDRPRPTLEPPVNSVRTHRVRRIHPRARDDAGGLRGPGYILAIAFAE